MKKLVKKYKCIVRRCRHRVGGPGRRCRDCYDAWIEARKQARAEILEKKRIAQEQLETAEKVNKEAEFARMKLNQKLLGEGNDTTFYPPVVAISKEDQKSIKQKEANERIVAALDEALREVKPIEAAVADAVDVIGDTLVIHITDFHGGKIVKDQDGNVIYNEEIFRYRINKLISQILKLLDNHISKGIPIMKVAILCTGDLANGEGIYATQVYEQEIAPPSQVMLVVDVLIGLILALIDRGISVELYGCPGNHGRLSKEASPASNWNLMIYKILDFWAARILRNSKFSIKYGETEHLIFTLRGHKVMIRHIAPEQVDSPSGRVKINEWARQHGVVLIVYGHFHHAGIFDCDDVRVVRGGSTVGGDSLSDSMAKHSEPIQVVFGINEQRVTTFIYLVDLGSEKKE